MSIHRTGFPPSFVYASRSSDTVLAQADFGKTIFATAAYTQTFSAAATLGNGWWCVIRNDTTDNTSLVTLDPNASETIDGVVTITLRSQEARLVVCDGSAFHTQRLGSAGSDVVAYLSADGTAITAIADIPTLQLAVGPNEIWEVTWDLIFNNTNTGGVKVRWSADGGAASNFAFFGLTSGATAFRGDELGEVTDSIAYGTFAGSNFFITVRGVYFNGAGATTLKLRATGQSTTAATPKKGSVMWARRLA